MTNINININKIIKSLPPIADIFAIPLWLIMILYFYRIENKTLIEYVLFLFGSIGLVLHLLTFQLPIYITLKSP